ncbi:hypothetical protein D9619_006302 [Psilocybe cf. subviscida]|uniref:Protein kinase domain-containing protein n=1 Tax=Psilocybe cf. subviscida TaxID=2480587 RepID=A0A8H5B4J5_9AGAR|nr:hypothetical protein D9619_006302 [Psilocybe cf. subviscida]
MSVFCLAIDHDGAPLGEVFEVAFDTGLRVASLKVKVQEMLQNTLGNDDISLLEVYHSPEILLDMGGHNLALAVSKLDPENTKVSSLDVVKDVVSDPQNMLLVIKRPARQASKRPRSPSDPVDHYDRLKRCNILKNTPSIGAQSTNYQTNQNNSDERLLDDRPHPDLDIPPISLLYGPFGEFDDIFARRALPLADSNIDSAKFEQTVDEFATAMLDFYGNEDLRRGATGPLFSKIGFDLPATSVGSTPYRTDGHYEVNGLMVTVLEIKKEQADTKSIPYVQAALYVGQSHKEAAKAMCRHWRVPALCITLVGHYIQFYGTLLLGHQYRTVSLTPALSCCPSATNGRDREHLYSAFAAALVLQRRIRDDLEAYPNLSRSLPRTLTSEEFLLPAVSKILEYGCNAEFKQYIEFEILRYHGQRADRRHLYAARVTKGEPKVILVKISRSYSTDLHDYCQKDGHAPELLGYEPLSGGWCAVAMEYLSDATSISSVKYSDHMEGQLTRLVDGFHEKDLVHGDLRSVNILWDQSRQKILLIDFDWGGYVGKVQYPTWNLNEDLRTGRYSKTLDISKGDDKRVLWATLRAWRDRRSN